MFTSRFVGHIHSSFRNPADHAFTQGFIDHFKPHFRFPFFYLPVFGKRLFISRLHIKGKDLLFQRFSQSRRPPFSRSRGPFLSGNYLFHIAKGHGNPIFRHLTYNAYTQPAVFKFHSRFQFPFEPSAGSTFSILTKRLPVSLMKRLFVFIHVFSL